MILLLACSFLVWLPVSQARCGDPAQNCTVLGCDVDGWSAHCRDANLTCVPACIPTTTVLLDLSYNNIVDVAADSFLDFFNVTYIDLSNNYIATLPADTFSNVPLLGGLTLDKNLLESVPDGILAYAPELYSLTVGNVLTRPIININLISNSRELVFVSISRSQLTGFSDTTLMNLLVLQHLYLEDNMLTEIPSEAFRFNTELRTVHLGGNNLMSVPLNLFSPLTQLSDLYLYGNRFVDISSDLLLSNHNLRLLDLGNNQLTSLEDLLFQPLLSLQTLYLYGNQLQQVVTSFQYNEPLWILDLRNNSFTNLPSSPLSANSDVILWLEGNPWNCGCWTVDFLTFVESRNSTVGDEPICEGPVELAGTFWKNLTQILVC